MSFRKLILSLCWLTSLNHVGVAQVNSRDPHLSPDFQTTCDEQVNNERVARAVPAADPTPIPAPSPAAAPAPTTANPENAKLPVDQIIQNAIRRDEELRELREEFTYQLKLVTQRLDDDNKVIPDKTKTVTAKIKPGKDITFSADFNDDSKDNDESSSKTTYAGATGGRGLQSKQKKSDDDDGDSNKDVEDAKKVNAMLDMGKIAPRFKYVRMPDQTVRDRPCFVIKFSPKPDQPFTSREEKVINKVGGLIWIDQNDFSIIQTKGKLTEEVDVAWFLASMKGMDFSYETSELSSINIPVPSNFFMSFDLNIMGYRMAQKQVSQMTDYQPISPNLVPATSPTPPPSNP